MKKFLILLWLYCSLAIPSECDKFYYSKEPTLHNQENMVELCFDNYVVMYSNSMKVPLWSAEKLTKEHLTKGNNMKRSDNFHEESRLLKENRAMLSDYYESGYDLGHMTPDKNYPWDRNVDSLANITPQSKNINRGKWARLERKVRIYANMYDTVYVLTGGIYQNNETIGQSVRIPSHLYKYIVIPAINKSELYVIENKKGSQFLSWSLQDLQQATKIQFH